MKRSFITSASGPELITLTLSDISVVQNLQTLDMYNNNFQIGGDSNSLTYIVSKLCFQCPKIAFLVANITSLIHYMSEI